MKDYDINNVFAKIIRNEIPSQRVGENEKFIALHDIKPRAPIHLVIIPKAAYASLEDVPFEDTAFMGELMQFARQIAKQEGISENYKIHLNIGPAVQQIYHLHLHLLGGWPQGQEPL